MAPVTRSRSATRGSSSSHPTAAEYIAQFAPPQPQPQPPVVVVSDDETAPIVEEDPIEVEDITGHTDSDEEMIEPTPVASPVATPVASPVASPVTSPAVSPAPTGELAAPPSPPAAVDGPAGGDETGWTAHLEYRFPHPNSYYHDLLEKTLMTYYHDMETTVRYECTRYSHPLEGTFWTTELKVAVWDELHLSQTLESAHSHKAKRMHVQDSMEEAAQAALTFYRGRRYPAMREDTYKYLPYYVPPSHWEMTAPQQNTTTMGRTVKELVVSHMTKDALHQELHEEQKRSVRYMEEVDQLREQLGLPPKYKKFPQTVVVADEAP